MPVYDLAYRAYEGPRRGPLARWWAIPKFALLDFIARRAFIAIVTLAAFPFVVRAAYLYLLANLDLVRQLGFSPRDLIQVGPGFFKNAIDGQMIFGFAFAFLLGAGLISRDLEHRALVLYACKPMRRWEYLLGKIAIVFGVAWVLTWVPASLLLALQWGLSPPESPWRAQFMSSTLGLMRPISMYCLTLALLLSLLILAASSLSRNGRYAGIAFAGFILGETILVGVLSRRLDDPWVPALSVWRAAADLGHHLFEAPAVAPLSLRAAWISLLAHGAGALLLLHWSLSRWLRAGR